MLSWTILIANSIADACEGNFGGAFTYFPIYRLVNDIENELQA